MFFGDGNGEGRDTTSSGQRLPMTVPHTSVGFVPIGVVAGYGVGAVLQSALSELLQHVYARRVMLAQHHQYLRPVLGRGAGLD